MIKRLTSNAVVSKPGFYSSVKLLSLYELYESGFYPWFCPLLVMLHLWGTTFPLSPVDLRTIDHADEPILVDDSPPIAGDLFDGPYSRRDLMFTKDRNEVNFINELLHK